MTRALASIALVAFHAALAPATEVEVTRLDGTTARGDVGAVVPAFVLHLPGGAEEAFAWPRMLAVRVVRDPSAPLGSAGGAPLRLVFLDESSLSAEIAAAGEHALTLRRRDGGVLRVETAMLRAVLGSAAAADAARTDVERALASDSLEHDLAVVARADRVFSLTGRVLAITPEAATFDWNGRELRLGWDRVAALVLARAAYPRAACLVRLVDGDLAAGRVVAGDPGGIVLESAAIGRVELSWDGIDAIECRSDEIEFLSALEPRAYEFTPYFVKRWPLARDRTLLGGPIVLGGATLPRGVCLHSRARATYALAGQRRFAALVGIVDEMGGRGCADVRVLGDGRVVWEAVGVRGGQPPREVVVDLAGARELTLEVDYGDDLDLSDHVAFGMARLIR